jgi:hypothetical protein
VDKHEGELACICVLGVTGELPCICVLGVTGELPCICMLGVTGELPCICVACICVLGVTIVPLFLLIVGSILELFRQCGILCFSIRF